MWSFAVPELAAGLDGYTPMLRGVVMQVSLFVYSKNNFVCFKAYMPTL